MRCRRCPECLKARQHQWVIRAAREQMRAKRSWFVTTTFGPKCRAAVLSGASSLDGELSQQARLVRASGWFVSGFFKRLRKAGFAVRYVMIPEPHGDGFPHWHGLIHEADEQFVEKLIMKKDKKTGQYRPAICSPEIESTWNLGWCDTEKVRDAGAIRYVTKYMAKHRYGKIRASIAYGADEE